jgi:hypothetical protein
LPLDGELPPQTQSLQTVTVSAPAPQLQTVTVTATSVDAGSSPGPFATVVAGIIGFPAALRAYLRALTATMQLFNSHHEPQEGLVPPEPQIPQPQTTGQPLNPPASEPTFTINPKTGEVEFSGELPLPDSFFEIPFSGAGAHAQMSIKNAPRVAFGLQLVPKWRARVDLARLMTRKLSKRFGHIWLHLGLFFKASVLVVHLNGEEFFVVVRENKYSGNTVRMWEIAINPSRFPVPGLNFPEDEQRKYTPDLMVLSHEVHAVLARTPGVTRLRWWLVGWDVKTPGVRTPAELPWHRDVPEPSSAESREMS